MGTVISLNDYKKSKNDIRQSENKKQFEKIKNKIIYNLTIVFQEYYENHFFTDSFSKDILRFFAPKLSEDELIEAFDIACDRTDNADSAINYFCGICWNKIRQSKGS